MEEQGGKRRIRNLTRAGHYRSLDPRTGDWQVIVVQPGKVPLRTNRLVDLFKPELQDLPARAS